MQTVISLLQVLPKDARNGEMEMPAALLARQSGRDLIFPGNRE